jgi:hypothetical protein
VRITRFDLECADRLLEARKGISCPADVPVEFDPDTGEATRCVTGPESMARVDIARLRAARSLAREADVLAEHHNRKGDKLTASEQESIDALRGLATEHRGMVRSFELDREDRTLRRGREAVRPVCGPARPFASVSELHPSGQFLCPRCNAVYNAAQAARMGEECLCPKLKRRRKGEGKRPPQHLVALWVRPELAERWALVQARAEAREGVRYEPIRDEMTGLQLGVHAVLTGADGCAFGFGALLEIAGCAPKGPRDPYRIAASRQEQHYAAMVERETQAHEAEAAAKRADSLRAVEAQVRAECLRERVAQDIVRAVALHSDCVALVPPADSGRKKRRRGRSSGARRGANRPSPKGVLPGRSLRTVMVVETGACAPDEEANG